MIAEAELVVTPTGADRRRRSGFVKAWIRADDFVWVEIEIGRMIGDGFEADGYCFRGESRFDCEEDNELNPCRGLRNGCSRISWRDFWVEWHKP